MATELFDINPLNLQNTHWNEAFQNNKDMFGDRPSEPAVKTLQLLKNNGVSNVVELGGGQGRDTLFFAKNNIRVTALDYSQEGIDEINRKVNSLGLADYVSAICYDIRKPLPFLDNSVDACYAHMLFCMALTTTELEFLSNEICRILKPGGICIYTVRNTNDVHFGQGIHRGEDMYEVNGFIVHFFSEEKVKQLSKGFEVLNLDSFEEGELPRKLYYVVLKK